MYIVVNCTLTYGVDRYTPKVLEEMELRFDKQRQARRRQVYS